MSASPDTGNLADVLRQLVALAEDHTPTEAPSPGDGNQPEGTGDVASETEKVESAKSISRNLP